MRRARPPAEARQLGPTRAEVESCVFALDHHRPRAYVHRHASNRRIRVRRRGVVSLTRATRPSSDWTHTSCFPFIFSLRQQRRHRPSPARSLPACCVSCCPSDHLGPGRRRRARHGFAPGHDGRHGPTAAVEGRRHPCRRQVRRRRLPVQEVRVTSTLQSRLLSVEQQRRGYAS